MRNFQFRKTLPILLGSGFIFVLFFILTSRTPLAGDDWGYALNGVAQNPLISALEFYQSWSGRFLSELYGFLVAPNKWFWNILNPTLFLFVFLNILLFVRPKNGWLSTLLLIFLILSVKDDLRMETYTWIMGTTYIIPLCLSLFIFLEMDRYLLRGSKLRFFDYLFVSLSSVYIGLTMENIAVSMTFASLVFVVWDYVTEKRINRYLILNFLLSLASLAIMRLSPGANLRLHRDHQAWIALSLVEQLLKNYPNFLNYTFIQNKFLVLAFSSVNLFVAMRAFLSGKHRLLDLTTSVLSLMAIVSSLALSLSVYMQSSLLTQMTDPASLFSSFFWPVFILFLFINLFLNLSGDHRIKVLFLILLAGLSNGAMMLSPIFGFRSSVYTVFFMFVATLILFEEIRMNLIVNILMGILLVVLVYRTANNLNYKYALVQRVDRMRMSQIEYYRNNPQNEEAWLLRYPIYTIHGGDIEPDDVYHMEVFKEYFGINPDMKLIFYFPEESYETYLSDSGW